jgi:Fe-S oxidoreductase
MATYKAEFLSHYYEEKGWPLRAYAFGMINKWAHRASHAPRLANFLSEAPGLTHLLRMILHLAPERRIPQFAHSSFKQWARKNRVSLLGAKIEPSAVPTIAKNSDVILWVDTFNNYFHPETCRAALGVLTEAGFSVKLISRQLCCGRPLYDFGMLVKAKEYLQRILEVFQEQVDDGIPIIVLEPSCASVFRDELHNLFPKDPRATRLLSQTFLLSEFLEHHVPGFQLPRLFRKVLLHGHCHHKALMKMSDEESLLRKMGADLQSPDSGCCGMAGAFGFEKKNYSVSQAVGERVLLPAVRNASPDTLIVSDGFSCREQIRQATGRQAIHLAEAIQLAGVAERASGGKSAALK